MTGQINTLASDTYGSHVVQRALDEITGFDELVVTESDLLAANVAAW